MIDAGPSDDQVLGGSGNEILRGGDGDDLVEGNGGDDLVQLGAGSDFFDWQPGDGSDTVDGGEDIDQLYLNGTEAAERIAARANAGRLRLTRPVTGEIIDAVGVELLPLDLRGGADSVAIGDLTGTGVKQVFVGMAGDDGVGDGVADSIRVDGTAGDDAVTVSSTPDSTIVSVQGLSARVALLSPEPADRLTIETLAGDDIVDTSGLVPGTIRFTVH